MTLTVPREISLASQHIQETKTSPDAKIERRDATVRFYHELGRNQWLLELDAPTFLQFHLTFLDLTMSNSLRRSLLNGLSAKADITFRYKNFNWKWKKEPVEETKAIEHLLYLADEFKPASFVDMGNKKYEVVVQPVNINEILVISFVITGFAEPISQNTYSSARR